MTSAGTATGVNSGHSGQILRLAIPVILAELGWMLMGVVDTIMVGPLGPAAIGAVSIGNALFDVAGIFGIGLLLGLDTLIAQAFGAGRRDVCDRWLWHGLYLAILSALVLMMFVEFSIPAMRIFGVQPGVLEVAVPYVRALNFSLLPLLLYAAFRRYLQGLLKVGIVMFALISANVVNAVGNYYLIPMFGVEGSGWSTLGARIYMAGVLALFAFGTTRSLLKNVPRPSLAAARELLLLGGPAAGQILLEVGVFAAATMMAAKLNPESLAAHHIALMIAATSFMIPLGLSSAGAVLVGNSVGRGDMRSAKTAGWLTVAFAAGFMSFAAIVMFLIPTTLVELFTKNSDVLRIAVPLLSIAAVFQIFDGIQVSATGILRGAGDTRTPMLANLVAHWALGLPAGYILCFVFGMGVFGLWAGLSAGLILVGLTLLAWWWRYSPRRVQELS
ncbi:MAG: MATE family efflux transporter [Bryobacteraceae bacterium]|nr:MATE family efflux transporter [Bryobacteraceae bacterium]